MVHTMRTQSGVLRIGGERCDDWIGSKMDKFEVRCLLQNTCIVLQVCTIVGTTPYNGVCEIASAKKSDEQTLQMNQ